MKACCSRLPGILLEVLSVDRNTCSKSLYVNSRIFFFFLNYINYREDERPASRYPHTSMTHICCGSLSNVAGHDQREAGG